MADFTESSNKIRKTIKYNKNQIICSNYKIYYYYVCKSSSFGLVGCWLNRLLNVVIYIMYINHTMYSIRKLRITFLLRLNLVTPHFYMAPSLSTSKYISLKLKVSKLVSTSSKKTNHILYVEHLIGNSMLRLQILFWKTKITPQSNEELLKRRTKEEAKFDEWVVM